MNSANLIPVYRQIHDARQARVRAWSWALGGIASAMALACACCCLAPSQFSAPPAAAFSKAALDLSKANQEAASLRRDLAALSDQVASRQFIVEQPDYSLLLGVLSQVTEDQVILNHCELTHDAGAAREDVLKISGFARTQPSVAAFMLGLEATGIFKNVTLIRSSEQPLLGTPAAGFQIQCVIGPDGRGRP